MTPGETGTGTAAASERTRVRLLEELGDELVPLGFTVRLSRPRGQSPYLHVVNPDAAALAENVLAEESADGWWYRWSWSERIAPAADVAAVAARIARVLAAR